LIYSTYFGGVGGDVVRAVAVDANNNAFLAGTTNSGSLPADTPQYLVGNLLYRTTDGGVSMDTPRSGLASSAILALAADPFDYRTIYAGTPEGLFKSSDGGNTWSLTGLTQVGVGTIAVGTGGTVYAASNGSQLGTLTVTGNHGGLWKSTDGGATFTRLPLGPPGIAPENFSGPGAFISFLLVDPSNPQTLYAVTGSGGFTFGTQAPIFKSTDGGATWSQIGNGILATPTGFAMDPNNSSTLYASTPTLICCGIGAGITPGQFFRSDDAGATWRSISTGNFPDLTAGPGILFSGTRVSTDGGVTWTNRTGPRIVGADSAGVYGIDSASRFTISTDGGATWNPVGGSPTQPYTAFAVTQGAIYLGSFVWNDSFVTRLDPNGVLLYTRYLGGSGYDEAKSLAIDPSGTVYVAGITTSYDFPAVNALMPFNGGYSAAMAANSGAGNGFVTALDSTGAVSFSTNVGPILGYPGLGIAFDPSGNLHVVSTVSLTGAKDIRVSGIARPH
jgi:photosystem II stability/assembly factor-like uncharacterized protein